MTTTTAAEELAQSWAELRKKLEARDGEIDAIAKRLQSIDAELHEQARAGGLPTMRRQAVSFGRAFVESDEFRAFGLNKQRSSAPFHVGTLIPPRTQALTSDALASTTTLRLDTLMTQPQRRPTLRDLIPVITTTAGAVEYVRVTGYQPVATTLAEATTAGDTSVVVASTAGITTGSVISVDGETTTVTAITGSTLTVSPAVGVHAADAPVTASLPGPTAEGELKPLGNLTLTAATETIRTIAAALAVSRQALADQPQLQALIDNQLSYALMLAEERQFLYGNGTPPNLHGILTDPDIQTYNWSDGMPGDTMIDALRRGMTRSMVAELPATGVVVNPYDWETIQLTKENGVAGTGAYVYITVAEGGEDRFFAVPVVVTTAISPGTALVGGFAQGATIRDREEANIRVSEDYQDFFLRNMAVVLAEERVALTIERPEAFVQVVFDNAPA